MGLRRWPGPSNLPHIALKPASHCTQTCLTLHSSLESAVSGAKVYAAACVRVGCRCTRRQQHKARLRAVGGCEGSSGWLLTISTASLRATSTGHQVAGAMAQTLSPADCCGYGCCGCDCCVPCQRADHLAWLSLQKCSCVTHQTPNTLEVEPVHNLF